MKTSILVLLVLAAIVAYGSMFTVDERERAIMFRLGEIVREDIDPGLHFKLPFINNVRKFDGRILTMDALPERYLTAELKNVRVDAFVKWRINDVGAYYRTMGGDETRANMRLSQIIKDGLRGEFGKRTIQDVVSGERALIMDIITAHANRQARNFGIDVVDVRLKRVDLPDDISVSIYRRMEAERTRVANELRSRGAEAAERIRADADRQRTILVAEAQRDAERIRGEGDARAAAIFAEAFSEDAEFFSLYRSLAAYRATFNSQNDVLVLEPDSEFFKYFTGSMPGARGSARAN
ncbi:protease modulator HflC [Ectothiorhodospiraceae bacterium 2226]|nr:protease modulator HflC [Ectothiorhodospiraceae bacterium 2226]